MTIFASLAIDPATERTQMEIVNCGLEGGENGKTNEGGRGVASYKGLSTGRGAIMGFSALKPYSRLQKG
jgi:hypothetical protein